MKKVRKKRKNETEPESGSDEKRIQKPYQRLALADRRHRMNVPRRGSGGGGGSNPRGYFIHHNFRYGPEPPAYKTPKREYPSYTRREPERPPTQDRHLIEKSVDEKLFERFMRRYWKEQTENDEAVLQEFPELKPKVNVHQDSEVTAKDLEKATITLEKYFPKTEIEPLTGYIEKKKQELKESEFDQENLLKQLEVYPTEELREKTLAQLNSEPAFNEEEIEGSKVETNEPIRSEPTNTRLEVQNVELPLEYNVQPTEKISPETMPEPLPDIAPISETEILNDLQDLMLELEPEMKEEEQVELSY